MPTTNIFNYALEVILQLAKDLLWFPLWWYSVGFFKCIRWSLNFLGDWWKALGIGVWVKYLFVPMYGQRDIASRFISFFMRLIQIIVKGTIFIIWIIISITIVILWLVTPVVIIMQIFYQLKGFYGS